MPQIPPLKKKRKSPAQRRRTRKRFQMWLEKRKSGTGYDQRLLIASKLPTLDTVNCGTIDQDQDTAKTVVSPQDTCKKQLDAVTKQPLLDSPQGQLTSTITSLDSELDFDGEDIDDQEFCVHCLRQPPECALKRCTRCRLSHYCSVSCQKTNWQDHKGLYSSCSTA